MTIWLPIVAFIIGGCFGAGVMSMLKVAAYEEGEMSGWRACALYIAEHPRHTVNPQPPPKGYRRDHS